MFIGFRPLVPSDEPAVLAMFGAHGDFFEAATGSPSGPGDVQSLLYALPDGATEDQKRVLAITADDRLAGVIDVIADYPERGTASLGLFMIDPGSALHGFGMPVAALAGERALAEGMTTVRASCPMGWAPGEGLLRSLGFTPTDGVASDPNRAVPAAEAARHQRTWIGRLTLPPTL